MGCILFCGLYVVSRYCRLMIFIGRGGTSGLLLRRSWPDAEFQALFRVEIWRNSWKLFPRNTRSAAMKDYFFLPLGASKARLREAENARKNRAEILRAFSPGKVSRRELIKWGLIPTAGALA